MSERVVVRYNPLPDGRGSGGTFVGCHSVDSPVTLVTGEMRGFLRLFRWPVCCESKGVQLRSLFLSSALLSLTACGDAATTASDEPDVAELSDTGAREDAAVEVEDTVVAADAAIVEDTRVAEAAADTAAPPTPGPKLKAMSFNIRVGTAADGPDAWPLRRDMVFKVVRNQDADLVGLQEDLGFQISAIMDAVPGYKRIGVGARDGKTDGEHCAILYRSETLALKDSGTFWLSGKPNEPGSATWGNEHPRVVTWGLFSVKATKYEFYLYNTHFDHASQNAREKSALLMMNTIQKRTPKAAFLVMGDLNVQEDNVVTRYFKGDAKIDGAANPIPLFDTFRVLHPGDPNARTAHGFSGAIKGDKIDYIYMATKDVLGAHIDHYNEAGRYPSDHYPIVTTVKLPNAE